jgi:hypothetical protein
LESAAQRRSRPQLPKAIPSAACQMQGKDARSSANPNRSIVPPPAVSKGRDRLMRCWFGGAARKTPLPSPTSPANASRGARPARCALILPVTGSTPARRFPEIGPPGSTGGLGSYYSLCGGVSQSRALFEPGCPAASLKMCGWGIRRFAEWIRTSGTCSPANPGVGEFLRAPPARW